MEFRILGPVEVRAGNGVVSLPGPKPRALLVMLLLNANEPVSAERMAIGLWGEEASAGSVKTVVVHVSRLRRALDDTDLLSTTPAGYRLRVRAGELDSERFEHLLGEARDALTQVQPEQAYALLSEALALWRGPALADFALEPFAQAEIARLEELRLAAVEERFEAALAMGQNRVLVADLERLVGEHPTRERLLGQLMRALYRCGRQADALAVYRRGRQQFDEELGLELSPELHELEEAILRHDAAIDAPPRQDAVPASRRTRIPVPLTSIIGRHEDLCALEALVGGSEARLVTLTGPGGVGKTRLAFELVHTVADRFDAGGAFTSLAEVPRADDVEQSVLGAIARTVGAHEQGGTPLTASLIDHLSDKHLLLVLDNFEHVVAASPAVVLLLGSCERLSVLVTSREALRVPGEREYPLAPLALPDLAQPAEPARLGKNEAVALFVERARGVQPSFALSDVNASAVAAICVRLDGLPLALELAAARIKMLSPPAMLARLEQRIPTLTSGARGAPEHQRTLAATITWGYELLDENEQRAFARLSVFRGGFPLEAAQEACDADIDVIGSLADKSLLRQADDRFVMLETIRDYAQDRLATCQDGTEITRRHAEWMMSFLEHVGPHLYGRDQAVWLQRLDQENDNLRAALDGSRALDDHRLEFRLLTACWHLWYLRGRYAEGEARLESALPAAGTVDPELRRDLLNALFAFHRYQGRLERASALAAQSLELRHTLPETTGLLRSLINAALAAGDAADRVSAENLTYECVALADRLDEPWCHAVAMTNLADLELQQDRYEQAAAHAAEASRLHDDVGDPFSHAVSLANLAAAELELTDTTAAVGHLKQALRQLGSEALPDAYFYCIDGLAAAEARQGHAHAAARLIGMADAIIAQTNFALQGFERSRRERTLATLADHLDAAAIAQARADGAALPIAEAVALALQTAA